MKNHHGLTVEYLVTSLPDGPDSADVRKMLEDMKKKELSSVANEQDESLLHRAVRNNELPKVSISSTN